MAIVEISAFTKKVLKNIAKVPKGKVATYKQIAALSGKPQGSRGVAWILHSCSTTYKLPWHRILNAQGHISFKRNSHNFRQQKKKLEAEGIYLDPAGHLDLKKFQWKKRPAAIKNSRMPKMFSK